MEQKIIFLRGLIASGKTTWAKKWVEEDPDNRFRVNKDDLRLEYPNKKEQFIVNEEFSRAKMAMGCGKSIVVDDTNFNPVHEERYRKLAFQFGAEFEIKEFEIDPLTAIERDSKRDNPVGSKAIIDMYKKYIYKEPAGFKGEGNVILCDIDGTVAYKCDRNIYDYTKVAGDYPNMIVFKILHLLRLQGYKIVFLSGREDNCFNETSSWISQYFTNAYTLLMRKAGDKRPDTVVKKEIFDANFKKEDILLSIDDRPCMTRLWKTLGIYTLSANQEPWNLEF